jgi:hypothetical protein
MEFPTSSSLIMGGLSRIKILMNFVKDSIFNIGSLHLIFDKEMVR